MILALEKFKTTFFVANSSSFTSRQREQFSLVLPLTRNSSQQVTTCQKKHQCTNEKLSLRRTTGCHYFTSERGPAWVPAASTRSVLAAFKRSLVSVGHNTKENHFSLSVEYPNVVGLWYFRERVDTGNFKFAQET